MKPTVHALITLTILTLLAASCTAPGGRTAEGRANAAERVSHVLDALHANASRADFDAYFALLTPDAVFLGTDGTERWTVDQFKDYTRPHFDSGRGWTFTMRTRHIHFSDDARTAWFDELLDNAKYGQCRGSGVLVRSNGRWRIAQYNLTKTIPNERMDAVIEAIGD